MMLSGSICNANSSSNSRASACSGVSPISIRPPGSSHSLRSLHTNPTLSSPKSPPLMETGCMSAAERDSCALLRQLLDAVHRPEADRGHANIAAWNPESRHFGMCRLGRLYREVRNGAVGHVVEERRLETQSAARQPALEFMEGGIVTGGKVIHIRSGKPLHFREAKRERRKAARHAADLLQQISPFIQEPAEAGGARDGDLDWKVQPRRIVADTETRDLVHPTIMRKIENKPGDHL